MLSLSRAGVVALVSLLFGCGEAGERATQATQALSAFTPRRVSGTVERQARRLIHVQTERETLLVTPEHPFASVDSGWIAAGALAAGDFVVSASAGVVRVSAVHDEVLPQPVTVFNLSIERTHAYLVGAQSILVHNTGCNGPGEGRAERLKRIVALRLEIARNRLAEQEARAAREQLAAAGRDASEADRRAARFGQRHPMLLDRLAAERVQQVQRKELTDTGWMNGTPRGLERARLKEIQQELARGPLSEESLNQIERELARSEPITPDYLAAIWRELRTVARHENLSSLRQELLQQFREFSARDAELRGQYDRSLGARRYEVAELRSRLRGDWQNAARSLLEQARQELAALRAAPDRRNEALEAEVERTLAFIEGEVRKTLRMTPQGTATKKKLDEACRKYESQRLLLRQRRRRALRTRQVAEREGHLGGIRAADDALAQLERETRELMREVAVLSLEINLMDLTFLDLRETMLDEAVDVDEVLRERDELMAREPSPERARDFESIHERLQAELREDRLAAEAALSALANEQVRIQTTQAGSSSGPTWQERLRSVQAQQAQVRAQWHAGLQARLDSSRRQLGIVQRFEALRDEEVEAALAREITLLERELQNSVGPP